MNKPRAPRSLLLISIACAVICFLAGFAYLTIRQKIEQNEQMCMQQRASLEPQINPQFTATSQTLRASTPQPNQIPRGYMRITNSPAAWPSQSGKLNPRISNPSLSFDRH